MIGYRAWFYYAEKKADAVMDANLDNEQYNINDLISLTIPLDNPYQLEQKTFERVNGEVSYQGKTFRYVKRKVVDGNLIILCIRDDHKMVLKKAKTEYGNIANDFTGNGKNSSRSGLQKNSNGTDYIEHQYANLPICQCAKIDLTYFSSNSEFFSDPHISLPGKPPQFRA